VIGSILAGQKICQYYKATFEKAQKEMTPTEEGSGSKA
jgi:hypothetical protein